MAVSLRHQLTAGKYTQQYDLEWSLATQFSATDEFLFKWADAQKYSYSKGAGWIVSC